MLKDETTYTSKNSTYRYRQEPKAKGAGRKCVFSLLTVFALPVYGTIAGVKPFGKAVVLKVLQTGTTLDNFG